jgi:dipeptidyl aminopeptidase/acylaminoacyl peptidase
MGSAEAVLAPVFASSSIPVASTPAEPTDSVLTPELLDAISEIAGVVGAWCPSLSPDGHRIAYVTDRSGLPRLEVAHLNAAGDTADRTPRQVSPAHQEVISVAWSPDGQWLAYLVSPGGLIRAELHVMRPDGGDARPLAGIDDRSTVLAGCWTALPNTYAFSLADGRGPGADVCLVDVLTGDVRTVASGGFLAVTSVSRDGRRLIARRGPRGRRHLVIVDIPDSADGADPAAPARRLLAGDFPDEGTDLGEDGRFVPDGSAVYLRLVAGRERYALGVVPLDGAGVPGLLRVLAQRDDADLESYAILEGGRSAMLVWNVGDGRSMIEIKDLVGGSSYQIDIGQRVLPGWSVQADERSAILELSEPVAPRSLYHVDLADPGGQPGRTGEPPHRVIGLPEPALPRDRLHRPRYLTYPAPDGVHLHGLLYRPDRHGPLPTVVLLHGGPESQERPAFSILIQSLVAAGLQVFAPNVRGSTGYGLTFMGLDDLDRRESSFQDVPATVAFLVNAGLAQADRIGVHGWSYGGYLALVSLTRWPELFRSGSSHAGMSELASFFAETEPWMAAASVTEYGDPRTDAALLRSLSPLHQMRLGMAPTLLVHGEQDTNVPVGESIRAHRALLAAGVTTELMLLPGEGHTIVGHDGRISSTRAIVQWHLRWTS